MKGKTILFTWYHPICPQIGGTERVTDILAREFLICGYEVYYLVANYEYLDYEYVAKSFYLPNSTLNSTENLIYYNRLLEELNVDIVINQAGNFDGSLFFLNINNPSIKTISVIHTNPLLGYYINKQAILRRPEDFKDLLRLFYWGSRYYFDQKRYLSDRKFVIDFVCKNSTRVLTLSESFYAEIQLLTKFNTNVSAIPNPNTFEHEKLDLSIKKKEIIFVGRLDKVHKRPDRLLRIWQELYELYEDWTLIFIGDGLERENLERYVVEYNIPRVSFKGVVDPKPYYKRASILCMTSNFEGFGMVLTEAMTFGVAVIAFDSFKSVKDIIINNQTGMIVKPFKLDEYKKILDSLISDKKLREEIAIKGYEYVKKFSKRTIVDKWIELFDTL